MIYLTIDPAQFCRAFFSFITVAAIGASAVPALRQLLPYGPRTVPISETPVPSTEVKSKNFTVLDRLARLQVPHTWFTHFYAVSVASSAFWAYQLAIDGVIFRLLASRYASDVQGGMTMNQILITWALMAFQGSRRLYESVRLLKPSSAQMPMASYTLGIAFYLAVGVAVWAEGMRKSSGAPSFTAHVADPRSYITIQQSLLLNKLHYPSHQQKASLPFHSSFIASVLQHDSHVYLTNLKKYTLPERRLFRWILCPHYTSECAIYLALAIVAAPQGQVLNKTLSTVLLFTVANLTITSNSTRAWYAQKFGEEKIKQPIEDDTIHLLRNTLSGYHLPYWMKGVTIASSRSIGGLWSYVYTRSQLLREYHWRIVFTKIAKSELYWKVTACQHTDLVAEL